MIIKKGLLKTSKHLYFIGIAGAGMSAIAQYLAGSNYLISGSDRQFTMPTKVQGQLEKEGINCFPQDCSGLSPDIDAVIVSTAIEPTVPEYKKAVEMGIPIVMRSDLLAEICLSKKTIAVAGTSGKSTVAAMIFQIMNYAGLQPSLITGAGLVALQHKGKIGNAVAGKGEHLIIEADESDGSLVNYQPDTGIILNIDKDHKEISELLAIFEAFKQNIQKKIIVNQDCVRSKLFSVATENDFGKATPFEGRDFKQTNFSITFIINEVLFELSCPGEHSMANAMAAIAASGVELKMAAKALINYQGIYRRHQIIGTKNGVTVIDDYAHNPAKLAASMRACSLEGRRLITWFQPHGFGPTRFLRNDFVREICHALRTGDEIWMSEIYYAGGTTKKDISANDLIQDIRNNKKTAFFTAQRADFPIQVKSKLRAGDIILITGARDPSLGNFAELVFQSV